MFQPRQMHANLMRAAGLNFNVEQRESIISPAHTKE